jgi:hypothetical protein
VNGHSRGSTLLELLLLLALLAALTAVSLRLAGNGARVADTARVVQGFLQEAVDRHGVLFVGSPMPAGPLRHLLCAVEGQPTGRMELPAHAEMLPVKIVANGDGGHGTIVPAGDGRWFAVDGEVDLQITAGWRRHRFQFHFSQNGCVSVEAL